MSVFFGRRAIKTRSGLGGNIYFRAEDKKCSTDGRIQLLNDGNGCLIFLAKRERVSQLTTVWFLVEICSATDVDPPDAIYFIVGSFIGKIEVVALDCFVIRWFPSSTNRFLSVPLLDEPDLKYSMPGTVAPFLMITAGDGQVCLLRLQRFKFGTVYDGKLILMVYYLGNSVIIPCRVVETVDHDGRNGFPRFRVGAAPPSE